jgi:DNA-binding FadR family transcriptional regulator
MHPAKEGVQLSKVIPRRLPQEVSARLLTRIVTGECPPGSSLPPENDMAEEFGVSRVVVRDAIRILNTKGVVAVRQGRNTEVNSIETWNQLDPQILMALIETGTMGPMAHDLVEIRKMLEVGAAGLAAARASEEEVARLRELLRGIYETKGDKNAYLAVENQFHAHIWHISRNVLLQHLLNTLNEVFEYAKEVIFQPYMPDHDYVDHEGLCEAIANHDVAAARRFMGNDISRFENEFRSALENGFKNLNGSDRSLA